MRGEGGRGVKRKGWKKCLTLMGGSWEQEHSFGGAKKEKGLSSNCKNIKKGRTDLVVGNEGPV